MAEEHSDAQTPTKRISSEEQLQIFLKSEAYTTLMSFITALGDSVVGKPLSFECEVSENVQNILNLLSNLDGIVDRVDLIQQKTRFGNRAYQTLFDEFKECIVSSLENMQDPLELVTYLENAFGDRTRMDYGSGHELNFACFLLCLRKTDTIKDSDFPAVVLRVFHSYLQLCRKIQQKYSLEPAGSKGVWGLDDFQHLPFFFGAAQLRNNPHDIRPNDFTKGSIVDRYSSEYMFLECIQSIYSIKGAAGFGEHSPTLYSLTSVSSWKKMQTGMLKMYHGEVLAKFPVAQHIFFGKYLPSDLPAATAKPKRQNSLTSVPLFDSAPWGKPGATNWQPGRAPWAQPPNPNAGSPKIIVGGPKGPRLNETRGSARIAERGSLRPKPKQKEDENADS